MEVRTSDMVGKDLLQHPPQGEGAQQNREQPTIRGELVEP